MTPAMQREPTAYRSLLTRAGAVLADPEQMLARLVRGCIALAFTAGVRAVATSHRLHSKITRVVTQLVTQLYMCFRKHSV